MSTGPSRKEQRRQAARREMDRRAKEVEAQCIQSAANVDWGSATILDPEIRSHIVRLGGLPREPVSRSAVDILTREIKWPTGTFQSSVQRFREQHPDRAYEAMSDIEIQDHVSICCCDFEFAKNGSFYLDWQTHFAAVNSAELVPFGGDSHCFYLIGNNSRDPSNPLLYHVDHEVVSEEPYNRPGATVAALLALLIAA